MSVGIGDALRTAREEQGRTLEEASRATRIRSDHLRELEDERFDALGGDVYAKGFIRSYAVYLGLDPEPLLERYRREVETGGYDAHALTSHPVAQRPSRTLPGWVGWVVVGALVLVAALAVVGTLGERSPRPAAQDDPDVVLGEDGDDEPTPQPSPDEPEPSPSPQPDEVNLVLIFEETSWMRVTIDGEVVEETTVAAGETREYVHDEAVDLHLGNAGGVTIHLNDRDLGSPAGRGQVWRGTCTVDGCEAAT